MKNINNYEPRVRYTLHENMNIDVNSSLLEVIVGMGKINAVDCIRILKVKYGISFNHIARIMGVSPCTIRVALKHETFDYVLKEEKLVEGILRLQDVYLQDYFVEIEVEGEKEAEL